MGIRCDYKEEPMGKPEQNQAIRPFGSEWRGKNQAWQRLSKDFRSISEVYYLRLI